MTWPWNLWIVAVLCLGWFVAAFISAGKGE